MTEMAVKQGCAVERAAFTVAEFCEANRISRAGLYNAWRDGQGPRFFKLGARRLITVEAAREWRSRLEAEADSATVA